ncbi:MAG: peptidase U32 [Planctomyces sp.]|nr:peptidase U32 [Planctomyces sp.]
MSSDPVRPELLAPAGSREAIRAAIENGATAVYFGLQSGFNARARATNIAAAELPEVMAELHGRGVRGYVTLNTLVFSSELAEFEATVKLCAAAGVDAVLLQDLGAVRLCQAICPDLPIHASTQMTLTSAECIEVAKDLGISRVVLPRELSVDEISKLHATTQVPLEAFVHGALCVAYSGQCLTSESLGGRSANRGQCAQACRLPYELICDGNDVDLGAMKYLLSPQDLAAYELTPELIAAGVISFKIEGRLKTPEYVANITKHYREAIDQAVAGNLVEWTPQSRREMELSFSRGFSAGWLKGCDHKELVPGLSSSKRGVIVGTVVRVMPPRITLRLESPLSRGDGVVFDGDRTTGSEQGGRVYELFAPSQNGPSQRLEGTIQQGLVEVEFGSNAIDFTQITSGQKLWKTDDPQLTQALRKTFIGPDPLAKLPVDVAMIAQAGEPLSVTLTAFRQDGTTATITASTDEALPVANKHPIDETKLHEQFSRLGHTPFELRELRAEIVGGPMVPLSLLSKLRQAAITQLMEALVQPEPLRIATEPILPAWRDRLQAVRTSTTALETSAPPAQLLVLVRSLEHLELLTPPGGESLAGVYVDFADIRHYRQAAEWGRTHGQKVWLATPRIQKPGEYPLFLAMAKHGAHGFLVRNLAGMKFCTSEQIPFVIDFSLNCANELTAEYLAGFHPERITASYDLNREQLLDLVRETDASRLEVVVHQQMPMFHMEHCVYCAVLSPGTNKTNCGRPCDTHLVELRDRVGMQHPLTADVGCRNTLFNAQPQSAAEVVPELIAQGVRSFRLEFLNQNAAEIRRTIGEYTALLKGERLGRDVWQTLSASNRVGVTRGTLEERRNPLAIL